MTLLDLVLRLPLAFGFSLDFYSNWWNSPAAAAFFWASFVALVLLILALTLWAFRPHRP